MDILLSSGESLKDEATVRSLFIKEIQTFPEGQGGLCVKANFRASVGTKITWMEKK